MNAGAPMKRFDKLKDSSEERETVTELTKSSLNWTARRKSSRSKSPPVQIPTTTSEESPSPQLSRSLSQEHTSPVSGSMGDFQASAKAKRRSSGRLGVMKRRSGPRPAKVESTQPVRYDHIPLLYSSRTFNTRPHLLRTETAEPGLEGIVYYKKGDWKPFKLVLEDVSQVGDLKPLHYGEAGKTKLLVLVQAKITTSHKQGWTYIYIGESVCNSEDNTLRWNEMLR